MADTTQQKPPIYLYTDGASSGNPGPGGRIPCHEAIFLDSDTLIKIHDLNTMKERF